MSDFLRFSDRVTAIVLIMIGLLGILLIASASGASSPAYHLRQAVFLVVALLAGFLAMRIRTETVFRLALPAYVVLMVLLVVQLAVGHVVAGTRSWLRLGVISVQVSEFVKIPLALMLARYLARIPVIGAREFLRIAAMLGLPVVLIVLQPDMGVAFILLSLLLGAMLLRRVRLYVVLGLVLVLAAGSVAVWHTVLKPYQKSRVISFLNPEKFSQSSGYQIIQSRIAVGSGGLSGQGFMRGSQSQLDFLPTRHTDFIVSVLGEEFGFIGISLMLLLFFLLFTRQLRFRGVGTAQFYFVYLFTGLILFQFLVNILMAIGYFPVMGVPLPFVSYGGSSLLSFMLGEGLIFRMKLNPYLHEN
ncbi:MAG: FtsW/RodA/SpoVE family cell cycle protein [Acidobacteriota bacterium]|jgi:rod shape determining protein RodA|nr:FtsW/RodA/SpoVE family cell cycle protein [Acidobacteriota bacterium]